MAKELFAGRLKKVVPFEQDGSFFHRKAKKYIESNNYINALSYYRRAIEKDPDNQEYALDLAEVFSEMSYFHESNLILFSVMQKSPERTDCHFAIACNFLGLQEYTKAENSLDKYMEMDEYGYYAEEAQNLLDVLQSQEFYYEFISDADPDRDKALAIATKGKDLLDQGDYKRAVRELEKAIRKDPELIFARNNLALAYFCVGKIDQAIEVSQSIIDEEAQNIHANCNIALFLYEKGKDEEANPHLDTVLGLNTEDVEDLHKIAVTLCEMNQHEKVNSLLKKLLQYKPYDKKILHYMAISCYNLKKFKTALKYWDKIERIHPNNTISSYYKHYVNGIISGGDKFIELEYHFQVPYEEIIRRVKSIHDLLKLSGVDLRDKWEKTDGLESLLRWGLDLNDSLIKKAILNVVASFRDEKAEEFLRSFILRKSEEKDLIKEALNLLKEMDAKEPYLVYSDDSIVEVNVKHGHPYENGSNIFEDIPNMAAKRLKESYFYDCEEDIQDVWEACLNHWEMSGAPQIRKPEGWAAALELYYRIQGELPVNRAELAASWEVSYSTLMKNYNEINRYLAEFWEQFNLS
ncbi:MAG: tetratricopeptide repeat protein [Clostridiales bacterium]|nr:tetratricopeptide repeat protein [Clostridiales bacterium]